MAGKVVPVPHGRRKGSVRSLDASAIGTEIHPSQVAVLPANEWRRINEKLRSWENPSPTKAAQMQTKREELHKQSQSIVKNWENTIEGQRLKRLQARQIREEKEERRREEIDREEARFQAGERKKAIERARSLLYYQTDRVKQLNGALVLSEVLREREAQLVHKKNRQDRLETRQEKLHKLEEEEREKAILKDMQSAEERAKQRAALAQFHKEQCEGRTQQRLKERLFALEEQKQLDSEATEDQTRKKEEDVERVKKQGNYRDELDTELEEKKKNEAAEMQQMKTDDEKRNIYTKTKKHMEKLRKEKEAQIKKKYQFQQQLMRDNLQQQMDLMSSDEDQRIARAMEKQLAKRDAEQHEKQVQHMAATRDIHRHMLEQMAELEVKKKKQEELDQEMLKQRIIQDQKFHNQQLEKLRKANLEAATLQQFHVAQIKETKARKQVEDTVNIAYDDQNQKLLQVEEAQFRLYADEMISDAKERGGPLRPLKAAAREGGGGGHGPMLPVTSVRPSYLAADSTAMELPTYTNATVQDKKSKANTQKRLGFIW